MYTIIIYGIDYKLSHKKVMELMTRLETDFALDITNKIKQDNYYDCLNQYQKQGYKNKWK